MKKDKFTLRDFNVLETNIDINQRALDFENLWLKQCIENKHEVYWLESISSVGSHMEIYNREMHKASELISFVANDYLGMSNRKETKEAGITAIEKYGTGVCAAPAIGGYLDIHKQLEKDIADFVGQESSLIFSSGFGANIGLLNCLLGKNDIALIDSYVHTSVLDGLKGTNTKNISHNDVQYLDMTLNRIKDLYTNKLVIIDGVYSQDGDLALLPDILAVCRKHGAYLMVDDAHGIGVVGKNGRGTLEHFNLLGQVDIVTGTFSKSFGCVGGFVAANESLIQYLRFYANTTVFSAAITPQATSSVLKALEIIKQEPSAREKLWNNINYLKNELKKEGFDYKDSASAIFPIMIKDDYKTKEAATILLNEGIYVNAITYPAVRSKDSRLRVTVLATHSKLDIDKLVAALVKADSIINFK